MKKIYESKVIGLLIMLFAYVVAAIAGTISFVLFEKSNIHVIFNILISDVIATIVIYIFSLIFKTSSMYDPFWSVQSFIIFLSLMIKFNSFNPSNIFILFALGIYTIRLTGNFIIGFDNLQYIDWRYRMLKEKSGPFFQFVNFLGIMMFPTLVVYSMTIPLIIMSYTEIHLSLAIIFSILMLLMVGLELISDTQMKSFIKNRSDRSEVNTNGLWKYSRHPNYLGEISFWFMIAIPLMIYDISYWWVIFGPIINLLMFLFISIPMEEKHFKDYKPEYELYKKKVSMLLILPNKKSKNEEEDIG